MIALVVTNEKKRRLECVGEVIGIGANGEAEVKIDSPAFYQPPKIELVEALIESTPAGLRYRGDIAGAVLIPSFLWVSP